MGDTSQGTGSTTIVQPWEAQRPALERGFTRAEGLYGTPINYYPGQAISGFAPEQETAFGRTTTRATEGSPLLGASQGYAQDVIGGKYLTPDTNPYLKSYYDRALEATLPQLDSAAIGAGRYGSGAWGQMRGRTMADLATGIYGGAYETERGRQGEAAAMAPALAREDYADIDRLAGVGEERRGLEQAQTDEAMRKHEFEQLEPLDRLMLYMQMVSGPYGGETSSSLQRGGK